MPLKTKPQTGKMRKTNLSKKKKKKLTLEKKRVLPSALIQTDEREPMGFL